MKKLIVASLVLGLVNVAFANTPATTGEFGNHCAMGLAMGKRVHTDCKINWKDTATNKTYCFSSEAMKAEWAKNTTENITKATQGYANATANHAGHAMMEHKSDKHS